MNERLEQIYNKVEKILNNNSSLKREIASLRSELELSRDVQNRLKRDLERLIEEKEMTVPNQKLNNLAADNMSKEEIKAKIDQYISEIDNCIAQIEKL